MKILYLIPQLNYHGAARQLVLLVTGLPRLGIEPLVCVLGSDGPLAEPLRQAGIAVEFLGWQRRFDLQPFVGLRQVLRRFQPDGIHVWQPLALRVLRMVGRPKSHWIALSAPFVAGREPGLVNRWLLRGVDRILVQSVTEAERCRRLGTTEKKVVVLPPAVAEQRDELVSNQPNGHRLVACMGTLEHHKGFHNAIWAYGILEFLYSDVHLELIGDGPDRLRLEEFTRNIRCRDVIHMRGSQADGPARLARADVVWVPDLADGGGVNVALEAMAAGRPVVASRLPGLSEIVVEGQTGFLVPPGRPPELARQTRMLLDDAALRRRLGEAARQRAAEQFSVAELVRRVVVLYEELMASGGGREPLVVVKQGAYAPRTPGSE
jgi:starch synthase (maltosyl-transferring)